MDPRLLNLYEQELQYVREMGAAFAEAYPKIAGRLGLQGLECADPYVERLLEGFAFLAARVQLKLSSEFETFSGHLLEMIYPQYLAPTPSMCIAQFQPDRGDATLIDGFRLDRGITLRSQLGKGDSTACQYRTAHPVTLWPVQLTAAEYMIRDSARMSSISAPQGVKSALRLEFKTSTGAKFGQLSLKELSLHLRGTGPVAMQLYEQLLAHCTGLMVRSPERPETAHLITTSNPIRRQGFGNEDSLLPYEARSLQGYRLLQEYFAMPARFMFLWLTHWQQIIARCPGDQVEVFLLFDNRVRLLENNVDVDDFALNCTPAVNLFPQRADRVHVEPGRQEYQIVPDRLRPLDLEVFQVKRVTGFGNRVEDEQEFRPFYSVGASAELADEQAFYTVQRRPRQLSDNERRRGSRSNYAGSETYLSIVDGNQAPHRGEVKQLGLELLCTNRDLPLTMPVGMGQTDFTLAVNAPVSAIRILSGPTPPRPSPVLLQGELGWRVIDQLSLNYVSIVDDDQHRGAAALRQLLSLYADQQNPVDRRQIDGVHEVTSRPVIRPLAHDGPLSLVRGLELSITLEDAAFEGSGAFLLGSVLEDFFTRYVSINSFTETVVRSRERGEIMRWPIRIGRRPTL